MRGLPSDLKEMPMKRIRLGRTDLVVGQSGFGAIPIQRIGFDDARYLLRKAYENGVNFFDTARAYTDNLDFHGARMVNASQLPS